MFETQRSAAFPIPCDRGVILWKWVDLGIVAPFFMLEIASRLEGGEIISHRMTAKIDVLRDHVQASKEGILKRVFLLSPGYVNGSDAFQLDALDSVCSSPNNPMNIRYRLSNGRTLYFSIEGKRLEDSEYTFEVFKHSPETVVNGTSE